MGSKTLNNFADIAKALGVELDETQRSTMERLARDAQDYMNRHYEDYLDAIIKKNMECIASTAFTGTATQQAKSDMDKPFTAEDLNRAYENLFVTGPASRRQGKTEKQRAFMEMYGGLIFHGDYEAKCTGDVINGSCAGEYWSKDTPRYEVAMMPPIMPYPVDGAAVDASPARLEREVYVYADGIWMLENTPEDDVEDIADDLA